MKKIVSAILSAVILLSSVSCLSFSAAEVSVSQKIMELSVCVSRVEIDYGIYYYDPDDSEIHDVGGVYLAFAEESREKVYNDCIAADDILDRFYDGETVTVEEIDSLIDTIKTDVENLCVNRNELVFLMNLCDEDNANGYYDDDFWNEYQDVVTRANALLADENSSDEEISDIYWELRFKFNEMCVYNEVIGDVDGSGTVNVEDVTLLQRAIAKYTSLNCSQLFVAGVAGCNPTPGSINVDCATAIQRYSAGFIDAFDTDWTYQRWIEVLSDNLYTTEATNFYNRLYYCALTARMQSHPNDF